MTLTIPEDVRAKAEIYLGDEAGQHKTRFLLQETGLPSGLLPLRDIIECGYVEETGFVWLKQRKKVDHYFAKAGRHVSYGAEVSAVAEKGRLKKITGVKAKEMMIWVALHEICVDDPPQGKLHCKAIGGISRSFPVEAFEADGPPPPPPVAAAAAAAPRAADVVVAVNGNGNGTVSDEVFVLDGTAVRAKVAPETVDVLGAKVDLTAAIGGLSGKEEKETGEEQGKKDGEKDEGKAAAAAAAGAIEKVEEKMKELSTEHKQAEAVVAKN